MKFNQEILHSHILIVDDNSSNIHLLEDMLEEENFYNIQSTSDPTQVIPMVEQQQFDIILLDYRMPVMDGCQVLKALSQYLNDEFIPTIVLTAQGDDETRINALLAGANDFLSKPFKQWEVLLRMNNLLQTRLFYKRQRIKASEMEERVRLRSRELHETRLNIIRKLGRASEYRDNETGMHVIRMSKTSQHLSLAAGLSRSEAELILQAAPMHDLGKIGIPDQILLKPGRLDAGEFKIMKTHAEIGADIIGLNNNNDLLKMAHKIALGHHEKWDGSGYPKGLKGSNIPLECRIVAICDVFDALISKRPYKDPWPTDKALALIIENSGSHFDPYLVPHFNAILSDILHINGKYADDREQTSQDYYDYLNSDLVFRDEYLTGHIAIDNEHRKLINILYSIQNAIEEDDIKLCTNLMDTFYNLVFEHFRLEEKMLMEMKYPYLQKHTSYHQSLLKLTKNTQQKFLHQGDKADLLKSFDQIAQFFIDDIISGDFEFVPYLQQHGLLNRP